MLIQRPYMLPQSLHSKAQAVADGLLMRVNPRVTEGVICISGGGSTYASDVLTLTGLPLTTEWVRVGFSIYTFLADVAGPYTVKIGDSASSSIDNLVAAIAGGPGEGTVFGRGTQENVFAGAAPGAGDTMVATAKALGVQGNSIVATENLTNGSWAAATLLGGTAFVGTIDPKVSCGDGHWEIPSCTPVDGTAAVSTFTTVGQWVIPLKGLTQLWCPITAYTSGLITVQLVQAGAFKG